MEELETLREKIETAGELQSLVRVMKSLAAASVREYALAAEALEDYGRTVEMGLQVIMGHRPRQIAFARASYHRLGAIILGSEQGLCGNFNEQIVAYAVDRINETRTKKEDRALLVVGTRAVAHLQKSGQDVEGSFPFPGNHQGIVQVILRVLIKVEEWEAKRSIDKMVLFYGKPEGAASFRPHTQHLLPLDVDWLRALTEKPWPGRSIPTFTMDWDRLFAALIRQHLFFSLYRAFIESMASENTARLLAMQVANKNIGERIGELKARYYRTRQATITSELLDIITGYEALVTGKQPRPF